MKVLCLCCGTYYPTDEDCPNSETKPHSVELALHVANELRAAEIEHATPKDIKAILENVK